MKGVPRIVGPRVKLAKLRFQNLKKKKKKKKNTHTHLIYVSFTSQKRWDYQTSSLKIRSKYV